MSLPLLSGVRVVEVGRFLSAPYAGKLLADLGAEVIKVEPPEGDPARHWGPFPDDIPHPERSGLFLYLNANKKGITLNLSTATGRDLFSRLLSVSDALLHNLPPGEAEALGLAPEDVRRANPSLVLVAITPFGLWGSYRDYRAYDINLCAIGGVSVGIGSPEREPLGFPIPLVGYQAGAAGASALLVALLARSFTGGEGQVVDISEAECLASLYTGPEALMEVYQWRVVRRSGHRALDFPYPNCILRCKDGWAFIGAVEGRQWRRLLQVMGDPEWARDPRFTDRTEMNNLYGEELDGYLEGWLAGYSREDLLRLALENALPLAPVRTIPEVLSAPDLADFFWEVDHPEAGRYAYPGLPYAFEGHPIPEARPAPLRGQHNQEVYCGLLGLSRQDLVKLFQTGVL